MVVGGRGGEGGKGGKGGKEDSRAEVCVCVCVVFACVFCVCFLLVFFCVLCFCVFFCCCFASGVCVCCVPFGAGWVWSSLVCWRLRPGAGGAIVKKDSDDTPLSI